jgi:hypothetical protein
MPPNPLLRHISLESERLTRLERVVIVDAGLYLLDVVFGRVRLLTYLQCDVATGCVGALVEGPPQV